jgi:hypothetical protein
MTLQQSRFYSKTTCNPQFSMPLDSQTRENGSPAMPESRFQFNSDLKG